MKNLLPLINILQEQLWPVNKFQNCHKTNSIAHLKAYEYNQSQAHLLEIPIINWICVMLIAMIFLVYVDSLKYNCTTNLTILVISGIAISISIINSLLLTYAYCYLHFVIAKLETKERR